MKLFFMIERLDVRRTASERAGFDVDV
jgi:hypothetical protein